MSAPAEPLTATTNRRFLRVCASRGLSGVAFQMISVAIGWQLYLLTGSLLDLGLVGLAQFVPMLIASPLAGYVADSFERRRVAAFCQTFGALCAGLLLLGAAGGWLGRGGFLTIVALLGAIRAFEFPTLSALLPLLVERSQLSRAVSLYSASNQTAVILGPAIGGTLVTFTPWLAYGLAVVLFMIAAALIATLGPTGQQIHRARFSLATLSAGAQFIARTPDLLGSMTLDVVAVSLASVTAILPAFARDTLHAGPDALGLLRAAPAVGAFAMGLMLARRPIRTGAGRKMFAGVVMFGIATCAFGFTRSLPVAFMALLIMGAADVMSVVVRQSLVQLRTPDDMRGRVGAANSLAISSSNQLGDFRAGAMAHAVGLEAAILIGGLAAIAIAALWARIFPTLQRLDTLDGGQR